MGDAQRSRSPRGEGGVAGGAGGAGDGGALHVQIKSVLDGLLEEYSKGLKDDVSRMRDDVEARNRALMQSYDKSVQQRLEGHDQALSKLQSEIVQLRLQCQQILDNVGKMSTHLDIAEQVEGNLVADSLALAEWDRSPIPYVVSVSVAELAQKSDVQVSLGAVFTKANLPSTSCELVGAPQAKAWDLIFAGAAGIASTNAKKILGGHP